MNDKVKCHTALHIENRDIFFSHRSISRDRQCATFAGWKRSDVIKERNYCGYHGNYTEYHSIIHRNAYKLVICRRNIIVRISIIQYVVVPLRRWIINGIWIKKGFPKKASTISQFLRLFIYVIHFVNHLS